MMIESKFIWMAGIAGLLIGSVFTFLITVFVMKKRFAKKGVDEK